MKKVLAILLAVIMALSLVACGGGAGNGGNGGNGGTPDVKNPEIDVFEFVSKIVEETELPVGLMPMEMVMTDEGSYYNMCVSSTDKVQEKGALAMPFISSVYAHFGIVRAKNVSDVASLKTEIADNLHKNQWMCGEPSIMYVVDSGDYILLVYSNDEEFCQTIISAFDAKLEIPLGEVVSRKAG